MLPFLKRLLQSILRECTRLEVSALDFESIVFVVHTKPTCCEVIARFIALLVLLLLLLIFNKLIGEEDLQPHYRKEIHCLFQLQLVRSQLRT